MSPLLNDSEWAELGRIAGGTAVDAAAACVRPTTVEAVAELIGWSARRKLPVVTAGRPREGALRIDLSGLNRIRFHEPGDLTLGADAGLTVAELDAYLRPLGQFLPLDVPHPEQAALGSVLACHRSGPLRHFYGTVRDFTIGIEAVTAGGALIHGGGRVVKNVAGYDVMKLLIGSRGTLAVITGVHFRLFPVPAAPETVEIGGLGLEGAEALRRRLLRSPLRLLAFELSHDSAAGGTRLLARYSGREAARQRYRRELGAWALEAGGRLTLREGADDLRLWLELRDFAAPAEGSTTLRLFAPPAEGMAALARLLRLAGGERRIAAVLGRLGLGAFSLRVTPALAQTDFPRWSQAAAGPEVWLQVEPGSAPSVPWAAGAPALDRMRRLSLELDPLTRLNPQWRLADV